MIFSVKITRLRKQIGLTQDAFANEVGVSRQSVYKWESGQSYPEVEKLLKIARLFGVTVDALLDDEVEMTFPEKKKKVKAQQPVEPEVAEKAVVEKVEEVKEAPVKVEDTPAEVVEEKAEETTEEKVEVTAEERPEEQPKIQPQEVAEPKPETAPEKPKVTEVKIPEKKKGGLFGWFGRKK